MHLRPDHTSYTVSDMDLLLSFYRDTLGMEVVRTADSPPSGDQGLRRMHIRTAVLRMGHFCLELVEYVNKKGEHLDNRQTNVGSAHIAFTTDDVPGAYDHLTSKGVTFTGPPVRMGEGTPWMCYGVDPDGHRFELISRPVADGG